MNMQQPEMQGQPEQEESGVSIELMIKPDGSMSVSVEQNDQENAESQEHPVKSLDEALRMIGQIAKSILSQSNESQMAQVRQGYEGA